MHTTSVAERTNELRQQLLDLRESARQTGQCGLVGLRLNDWINEVRAFLMAHPHLAGKASRLPQGDVVTNGVADCRAVLGTIASCVEFVDALPPFPAHPAVVTTAPGAGDVGRPVPPRVFIVHGHDVDTANAVEKLVRKTGFEPIILVDRNGGGETIIDKFEREARTCDFAIVIMTADDRVGAKARYRQARPNVFFELGWFFARLGRGRVRIVRHKGAYIPSDIGGIERFEFESNVREVAAEITEAVRGALSPGGK